MKGSGFRTESDRKGPEVGSAARDACLDERRSLGFTGSADGSQISAVQREQLQRDDDNVTTVKMSKVVNS